VPLRSINWLKQSTGQALLTLTSGLNWSQIIQFYTASTIRQSFDSDVYSWHMSTERFVLYTVYSTPPTCHYKSHSYGYRINDIRNNGACVTFMVAKHRFQWWTGFSLRRNFKLLSNPPVSLHNIDLQLLHVRHKLTAGINVFVSKNMTKNDSYCV